jgi:hypothetical protein
VSEVSEEDEWVCEWVCEVVVCEAVEERAVLPGLIWDDL